ncbi:MAG TPA: TIGR00180 family glycosyltransferase [Candidatus Acidoferrales bacterium]|nr:TIGR00180 family glycosyltransferase [Candidatus Acidoferrales bacterium]
MNPRLTIVMPLKGRRLFTFRCLWHANELRLPYRFLLADGLVHEEVSRRLEDSRSIFPHLDIEYVRYPDDTDYSRFWAKMAGAYVRVRTPYVMNMDNDDFAGRRGIERALDFLDANPDFICSRGRSVDFSVFSWSGGAYGGLCGKFNRLATNHNYRDVTAATPAERLREGGVCHALYSAVFRTGAAALIWREIAEINFSDLMLHENFVALRALTLGKVHMDKKTVSKYPQTHTGISHELTRNWASHLLRSRFTTDAQAMIRCLASTAGTGAASAAATAEDVRAILENYYSGYLSVIYGAPARIKGMIRQKWPRLVKTVQTRPRISVWRERAELYSRLRKAGASAEDIRHVREDLATVERALSPEAFAEYAAPLLPLVKAQGGREWLYV